MSYTKDKVASQRKIYERRAFIKIAVLFFSLLILGGLMIFSIVIGTADVTPIQVSKSLFNGILGVWPTEPSALRHQKIILTMRLPRVLLGLLGGMSLSISGTVMQGITRNPLVSPFTIGLSSAAAFGASLSIILGVGFYPHTPMGIVLNAFLMCMACATLVYSISQKMELNPEALILTGVALNYLFRALTSTLQFMANENSLSNSIHWAFGSLNNASWVQAIVLLVVFLICFVLLMFKSLSLNAMASGQDEFVKSLGIHPGRTRKYIGFLAVILTATVISFTGIIGFVGLVSPHIARMLIGNDHRFLIPASGILGGILLLLADTIGRTLLSPVVIPVGIVVSYIGVPLFVNLLLARRKAYF